MGRPASSVRPTECSRPAREMGSVRAKAPSRSKPVSKPRAVNHWTSRVVPARPVPPMRMCPSAADVRSTNVTALLNKQRVLAGTLGAVNATAPTSTDMLAVGAGPAGSASAAWAAQSGYDVLLADPAVFPRDKTCGDGLTPRAVAELEKLGLGDWLSAHTV